MSQCEEGDLRDVPLLVFANKQDLPRALGANDVSEALRLSGASRPVGALGQFFYRIDRSPLDERLMEGAEGWGQQGGGAGFWSDPSSACL